MSEDTLWILAQIFLLICAIAGAGNIIIEWQVRRFKKRNKKTEWDNDEVIFRSIKAVMEYERSRGMDPGDLSDRLDRALARSDYTKAMKKVEIANAWAPRIQFLTQAVVICYGYQAYSENDIKRLALLALVFFWRSLRYWNAVRIQLQTLILSQFHMANPTAEKDYFHSDHCVPSHTQFIDRSYKLLKTDGYYDQKK